MKELVEVIASALVDNPSEVVVTETETEEDLRTMEMAAKELKEQAQDLGGRVVFLGKIPPAHVPECYAAADLFVSASTSETQGLTYFEALSCGKPVLCREDDCLRDVVRDGENGFLFCDYESFAKGLRSLLESDLPAMAPACRAQAEEFSLEKFAARAEELYLGLLRKNK